MEVFEKDAIDTLRQAGSTSAIPTDHDLERACRFDCADVCVLASVDSVAADRPADQQCVLAEGAACIAAGDLAEFDFEITSRSGCYGVKQSCSDSRRSKYRGTTYIASSMSARRKPTRAWIDTRMLRRSREQSRLKAG